jgi:hypothetical protein
MKLHRCVLSLAVAVSAWLAATAKAADEPKTIKGSIQDVRAAAHQVVVTDEQGKEWVLHVNEQSKLERHGRKVGLDQFKPGTHVQVALVAHDGENRVVSMSPAPVSTAEVQKEVRDTLQAAKSYTFAEKDKYSRRLQGVVGQVDDRIDHLKHQAARASAEAKKEYEAQIQHLSGVRDKLQAQAERVKSATPQAWDDLKAGVGSALEDLHKAFEKMGKHFR